MNQEAAAGRSGIAGKASKSPVLDRLSSHSNQNRRFIDEYESMQPMRKMHKSDPSTVSSSASAVSPSSLLSAANAASHNGVGASVNSASEAYKNIFAGHQHHHHHHAAAAAGTAATPIGLGAAAGLPSAAAHGGDVRDRLLNMLGALMHSDPGMGETVKKLLDSDASMKPTVVPQSSHHETSNVMINSPSHGNEELAEDSEGTDDGKSNGNSRKRASPEADSSLPEREVRLQKNRVAASKSRQKKKAAFEQLKKDVVELNMEKNNLKNQLFTYINLLENSYNDSSRLRMKLDELNLENAVLRSYVHPEKLLEIKSSLNKQPSSTTSNVASNSNAPSGDARDELCYGGVRVPTFSQFLKDRAQRDPNFAGQEGTLLQKLMSQGASNSLSTQALFGGSSAPMPTSAGLSRSAVDQKVDSLLAGLGKGLPTDILMGKGNLTDPMANPLLRGTPNMTGSSPSMEGMLDTEVLKNLIANLSRKDPNISAQTPESREF